jgi:hypothetical protein
MYQENQLSIADRQKLQETKSSIEAAKTLLNIIVNMKSEETFEVFLKTLQRTKQLQAYGLLTLQGLFC